AHPAPPSFPTRRSSDLEIVELLRQRSRPYLFSNSVAPAVVAASLAVLDLLKGSAELRERLRENTEYFRNRMTGLEAATTAGATRSEEHTSELQSLAYLV